MSWVTNIHAPSVLHPSMNIENNILTFFFPRKIEHINFIADIQP